MEDNLALETNNDPLTNSNEILTVEEVASFLRVNKKTVYDAAKRGEIPCKKIGRVYRFSRLAVLESLQGKDRISHSSRRKNR